MECNAMPTFPKRAQIVGQIFIYVLAIVVMGVILIYGYSAISDFRSKSSQVSTIRLQSDLSSSIDALSADYGSVKKKELHLDEYSRICLVESYEQPSLDGLTVDPLIRDSIRSATGKNAFLLKETVEASFTVDAISVDPDVLCLPARVNRVELRLEGKGDHVDVSSWKE